MLVCYIGTCHTVAVSEIVAVQELDVENGATKDDGRWQKMLQKPLEAYPYAFTGMEMTGVTCWLLLS